MLHGQRRLGLYFLALVRCCVFWLLHVQVEAWSIPQKLQPAECGSLTMLILNEKELDRNALATKCDNAVTASYVSAGNCTQAMQKLAICKQALTCSSISSQCEARLGLDHAVCHFNLPSNEVCYCGFVCMYACTMSEYQSCMCS